ncbi:hypothetical protein KI688_007249 [Linnemannia hyalina]|uniref:Uncharacterized protein n=1 Tax=Linnemannia hyalina TaxID=64524 RepID=A0A9P7XJI9_9FUNG|nr:hypothetical protein KI688_007249 [Linnemannia hyalina]
MQIYHGPDPVVISNPDPSLPHIRVDRDPNREMYYPCPHPECDYKSILRTNPLQHQKHCKFVLRDLKAARAPIDITSPQPTLTRRQSWRDPHAANIVAPRQQTQPTRQPSQRQFRPTFHYADQPSSSSSSARLAAAPFPSTGSTPNSNNTTASIVTQLLTTMDDIGNTVDRLNKQLDKNTKIVSKMNEQTKWVMDQVDEIRAQNASLEAHTESMRIDMGMTEDHLGALWMDTYKIKVALKGLREGG